MYFIRQTIPAIFVRVTDGMLTFVFTVTKNQCKVICEHVSLPYIRGFRAHQGKKSTKIRTLALFTNEKRANFIVNNRLISNTILWSRFHAPVRVLHCLSFQRSVNDMRPTPLRVSPHPYCLSVCTCAAIETTLFFFPRTEADEGTATTLFFDNTSIQTTT